MEIKEYKGLSKKVRFAMFIKGVVIIASIFIVMLIIRIVMVDYNLPQNLVQIYTWIMIIVLAYLTVDIIILELTIGYKSRKYYIGEGSIEYCKGALFKSRAIVPIRRMQQIQVTQGIILKFLGLATLVVTTGGGVTYFEYLEKEEAEAVSELLSKSINDFALLQKLGKEDYKGIIE